MLLDLLLYVPNTNHQAPWLPSSQVDCLKTKVSTLLGNSYPQKCCFSCSRVFLTKSSCRLLSWCQHSWQSLSKLLVTKLDLDGAKQNFLHYTMNLWLHRYHFRDRIRSCVAQSEMYRPIQCIFYCYIPSWSTNPLYQNYRWRFEVTSH